VRAINKGKVKRRRPHLVTKYKELSIFSLPPHAKDALFFVRLTLHFWAAAFARLIVPDK